MTGENLPLSSTARHPRTAVPGGYVSAYLTVSGINVTAVARSRTGQDLPGPGRERVS
jgi:hypothetical protein